jgi:hypothetical protein
MSMTRTLLALVLIVLPASIASPQTPQTYPERRPPDFRVQIWGDIGGDFSMRVWSYVELRTELERGLPPLRVTDDPVEISRAVRGLAARIRVARSQAKQGDIFTPAIAVEFRKALLLETNADTWVALMDDNPGDGETRINGTYPGREPFSTVPPNVLAVLPRLPDDIFTTPSDGVLGIPRIRDQESNVHDRALMAYLLALLIGCVAGLRTVTAPAAVSWAAHLGRLHLGATWLAFLGYAWTPWILYLV